MTPDHLANAAYHARRAIRATATAERAESIYQVWRALQCAGEGHAALTVSRAVSRGTGSPAVARVVHDIVAGL